MYREKITSWMKRMDFLLFDILALEISFILAYTLRHGVWNLRHSFPRLYEEIIFVLVIISLIKVAFLKGYSNIIERDDYEEFKDTFKHATFITLGLVLYLFMIKESEQFSRTVYIVTWELDILFTFFFRRIWKATIRKTYYAKHSISIMVVTTSEYVEKVIESLLDDVHTAYNLSGIILVDKDMKGKKINGVEVVAGLDDGIDYICRNWVDEVFLRLPENYYELENKIIEDGMTMGIVVHKAVSKKNKQNDYAKVVQNVSDYTVLSYSIKVVSFRQIFFKRCIDIVGGIFGLIITGILFIFVAPAIYIKSPGPIFFKQWRVGRNGKKFQIYKFRSMYMDAEERKAELMAQNKVKDGMMFKIENDPRIIGGENGKGIGNFIRNTSIDEFPQFLNVLKGDMSLVGTRPPTLDEWEKYKIHHRKRMAIKPGLTGMWQVSGRSDITDFEEVVRLDTEYINNWSLAKDFAILLKTVKVVIMGKGSC
ncbi:MAG: sugar transferase [Lachnospiraceae bacterium]|nr:sugar transferase [Lachnospiraceae bacterium]